MTTTSIDIPTAEDLRERLASYQQQEVEAAAELGRLELDGGSPTGASKRLREARERIARIEAALAELDRREAERAEQERQAAASAARHEAYVWAAEFMARAETVLEAKAKLEAAEAHLRAHHETPGRAKVLAGFRGVRPISPEDSDLDGNLFDAAYNIRWKTERGARAHIEFPGRTTFTTERARQIRGLAEQRADEEAAGEGRDYSGIPSARQVERHAARLAARQEVKKQRAREKAERAAQLARQRQGGS